MSYILRGTSKNHGIRIFAAATTSMVEEARRLHNTSPVASAALGRALTASSIMGIMMLAASKGTKIRLTVEGADEAEAMQTIGALIVDGFGEE